ncbi:L-dopachrome tautomerase-related protein [Paraburkholderia caballeronis]|uniref:Major royal jelly protein n=1 Tax=Paraburkholderia caballeronis TaxID=416943 RepID=A0A1H7LIL6_9BURK|nr:L-dopachrome tautomerase-related protein [Paraburkholderia caballeronis]PXW28480.1 major royal jelly protein [Paraburkholderia caballeronis]PXX03846.1 major royal jelly protein [Paraburkholderia caballeronis]RAK04590.1 major royal jelly protein [Paraburkholderia caballeronis]SED73742.1 Major royal jelly protein [Paraburkholderia caballeronis]SEK98832.1 Major royal jelly protein [Paraburkholderia caballeronis]
MTAAHLCRAGRRQVVAALGATLLAPWIAAVAQAAQAASAAASAFASGAAPAGGKPRLETVATFDDDFRLVGIGVSRTGRVFATAPASIKRSRYSMVEVDLRTGALLPFPDSAWNTYRADRPGDQQWISVQALWVDERDRLWALDSSLPSVDQRTQPPRLVEFDIPSGKLLRVYTFEGVATPKDSLNDVRIDLKHGYAFISNAGNQGGVVVTRLSDGKSRLVLAGDRSSVSDPDQHLRFGDRIARKPDGGVLVLQTDGIALSPERDWLYYRPLTDHHYWRIPVDALIDESLSATALAQRKQYLGDYALTGGLLMGGDGVLYGGDLEHRTVVALTPVVRDGKPALVQRTLVDEPKQVSWADGFALQNDYLYFADSHLHEVNFSNGYPREGKFTIFRVALPKQPAGLFAG